jgi:hypothetical protein
MAENMGCQADYEIGVSAIMPACHSTNQIAAYFRKRKTEVFSKKVVVHMTV